MPATLRIQIAKACTSSDVQGPEPTSHGSLRRSLAAFLCSGTQRSMLFTKLKSKRLLSPSRADSESSNVIEGIAVPPALVQRPFVS